MTSSSSLRTRDLTSDDLESAFDVRARSIGSLDPSMRDWWNGIHHEFVEAHRAIGIFDGTRLLAHAKVLSYQQFWGGRPMPMGGVAGVVVAPDARGRGVGSQLITALAHRSRELGDLVSALYPATITMYRALGWEVAGAQYRISIPAEALRRLGGSDVHLRIATESDVEPFLKSLGDGYAARRANGPKLPTVAEAKEQFPGEGMMSYLIDGGHVVYEWHEGDLFVSYLSAENPEIARSLWSVVGSGSSIAKKVLAYVAPDDPIHLMLPEEVANETRVKRWMLRVMDASKAVAARGFSPFVTGSAAVTIDDPIIRGNSGSWRLEVSGDEESSRPSRKQTPACCLAPTGSPRCMPGLPFISCAQPDSPRVAVRCRTSSWTRHSPAGRHTCWSTSKTPVVSSCGRASRNISQCPDS